MKAILQIKLMYIHLLYKHFNMKRLVLLSALALSQLAATVPIWMRTINKSHSSVS